MDEGLNVSISTYVPGGKRNLRYNFGLTQDKINKYIKKSLNRSCLVMRYYARTHHRYVNNTARQQRDDVDGLTRAIAFRLLDKAKRAELYIDSNKAPTDGNTTDTYGYYQIKGTKPHGAIHSNRLRFFKDKDRAYKGKRKHWDVFEGHQGLWLYPKYVRGIPEDDILGRAYRTNRSRLKAIFEEELRRLING